MNVQNLNQSFPKFPVTIEDKGWVYGVWYCGTSWQKSILYGQYPPTFIKRVMALFPNAKSILHCPSGTVRGNGVTVDIHRNHIQIPDVQADAAVLPFKDNVFDLILSDPPYSVVDSKRYNCKPFPMKGFMREARRVLKPNGYLGILHIYYPSYSRTEWRLVGLIAVVTGFCRATRMFSVFQNKKWSIDGF